MNNRIFLTLLMSAVLALPGFAQQSSSAAPSASAQTAPTSTGPDSIKEPIPAPTSNGFWDGDEPNLGNLVTHPFASKKYVQRMTRPIKDRLNELDEITTSSREQIKDVDSRAQKGLQMASEKVSIADQHATDASNKAQLAQTSATQASTHVASVEQMVGSLDQYKGDSQTEIRFRPGQSALSKQAKDALDAMAAPLTNQRNYVIEVRGFSSGHGQAAIANSARIADSVVRYLVLSHNIPVFRIHTESMGDATVAADGTTAKRMVGGRVEVGVLRNEIATAQQ